jgi:hypothetical protein
MYKCEVMGADCSACSSLSETEEFKYGCWWCDGQCAFKEWCEQESLERQLTCPKPNLEMVTQNLFFSMTQQLGFVSMSRLVH